MRVTVAVAPLLAAVLLLAGGRAMAAQDAVGACPVPPRPIGAVEAIQYYTDPKHSVIDRERARGNAELTAPLRAFLLQLGEMTDRALADPAERARLSSCALEWLKAWADADALSAAKRDGSVLRTIAVASLAFSHLKLLAARGACEPDVQPVAAWLHRIVADVVRHEAAGRPPGRESNVTFWAALAAYNAGLAAGDGDLRAWALGVYRRALDAASASGFWPSEVARGAKALEYQLFALTPLVLLRLVAEHHGAPDIVRHDDKLHRIIAASLQAIDDPRAIEAAAGTALEPSRPERFATTSTLIKAYACRFPERARPEKMPAERVRDWRLGTDLALQRCPHGDPVPAPVPQCRVR